MSKNKKSLQDLTLLDRFLFAEVMEDPKTFENILSIILGEVDFSNMKDCYSLSLHLSISLGKNYISILFK